MNWRMSALAAALLLIVPVGIGAGDDPLLEIWGDASAIVRDVELLPPRETKTYDSNEFFAREQVVEGHTTFATIEFRPNITIDEGNVTIDGLVQCTHHVNFDTWGGLPIPSRINEARAECRVGERVVVTPDPFTGDPGSLGGSYSYRPTGAVYPIRAPHGDVAYIEELAFDDASGKTWYAWATPIFEPWTRDGKAKNFLAPLPVDKLRHNDIPDYRVVLESDL